MSLTKKATELAKLSICDNCLGRQFAYCGHGLENYDRGRIIRKKLKNKEEIRETDFDKKNSPKKENKINCEICNNLFQNIENYAKIARDSVEKYEFNTFLIGSIIPLRIQRKEEQLWEKYGIENVEPIKSEINRLVGKAVQKLTKKEVDFKRPEINIVFDVKNERANIKINSIFVFGRYNKLERGIPQTKWPCGKCRGRGCEECDYSGKQYKTSVEELVGELILDGTNGLETKFHGCGREDIDALCLGKRPFVIEVIEPEIRSLVLEKLQKEINKQNKGRVEIFDLRFSDKKESRKLKEAKPDKRYRIKVRLEKEVKEKDLEKLSSLVGVIKQQTPQRVEHRRAKLVRKRDLKEIKWKKVSKKVVELILTGEAGLYIKELVTGDNSNTKPSVAEVLNQKVDWIELDVLDVDY